VTIPGNAGRIGKGTFEHCNEKLRCDRGCTTGPKVCNPICGQEGCTANAIWKLKCPGNEDVACEECPKKQAPVPPVLLYFLYIGLLCLLFTFTISVICGNMPKCGRYCANFLISSCNNLLRHVEKNRHLFPPEEKIVPPEEKAVALKAYN
jgi:hypothetical protein